MQQIIRSALERKTTSPNTRDQSSDRGDEQGAGIHRWVRDADGFRRSTSEPSAGDAQMGSAEFDIADNDCMDRQIERFGKRWGGQLPDLVCATISGNIILVGLGLRVFERRRG